MGISLVSSQPVAFAQPTGTTTIPTPSFSGVVTKVVDGDTLDVKTKSGKTMPIRLTLVDAPETTEPGYTQAKNFVTQNCLNKAAVVDPDNNQKPSFGRLVAVVYCDGLNINEAVIANGFATIYRSFCAVSEFENTEWAQKYGCTISSSSTTTTTQTRQSSSSSSGSSDKEPTGKQLQLDISVANDPIVRGNKQTITSEVSDSKSKDKVSGAAIEGKMTYTTGNTKSFSGVSDSSGKLSSSLEIGPNSNPGTFRVNVEASANGYESTSKSTTFQVIAKPTETNSSLLNSTLELQEPVTNSTLNTTNIDPDNIDPSIDGNDNGTSDDITTIIGCLPNQLAENGQCVDIPTEPPIDIVCQPNDPNCPEPVCPQTGCENGLVPPTQTVAEPIDEQVPGIVGDTETGGIGSNDGEGTEEGGANDSVGDDSTTDPSDDDNESNSDVDTEDSGDGSSDDSGDGGSSDDGGGGNEE